MKTYEIINWLEFRSDIEIVGWLSNLRGSSNPNRYLPLVLTIVYSQNRTELLALLSENEFEIFPNEPQTIKIVERDNLSMAIFLAENGWTSFGFLFGENYSHLPNNSTYKFLGVINTLVLS